MGFLAPGFLFGALAVGLPVYLHLLRRNTSKPLPFSSLMLFELRPPNATQRRRLRYWLLLALRVALLLLLAAAFAAPYVNELAPGAAPDKLLLVVVDNSFSMRAGTRLTDAKRAALALLSDRDPRQRAQVLELGAQAHVLTPATQDTRILRAALEGVRAGDSRGSFAVFATAIRSIAESEKAPIEAHLLSDLQKSNMPPNFGEMALPRNVSLVVHPVAAATVPNWAVESVSVPPLVWDPHTTRVQAVIAGYGTPAATRAVSFLVNGKIIATRQIEVPAAGRATAEINSLELPYGFSRCSVRIDAADTLPADDEYVFALERSDRKRGLFIYRSSDTRSPLYFDDAVKAAAQAAVTLDKVTADHAVSVDPESYSFVVLSDVASLPAAFTSKLVDYVYRGGNVLVALGTIAAQQPSLPVFGGRILTSRHYSRDTERFAAVGQTDSAFPAAGSAEEWEGVRFYYATALDDQGARVVVRLQDGTPLLLEKPVGEGRVMVFASGFDNLTNDLPLHPVFVAFTERIVRHLSGNDARSGPHQVNDVIALRTAKEQAVGVEVIEPSGQRPLSLQEAVSSQSYQLSQAGFYEVHLANGRQDLIGVNADRRESDLTPMPQDVLALWRGSRGGGDTPQVTAVGTSGPAVPRSLWWYAMLCLLAAVLAESVIGGRYLATLRDEP
ncbi:MAG TPA: BatA and WFA domain-containing protein [Steroidobacteraceae bacterium]